MTTDSPFDPGRLDLGKIVQSGIARRAGLVGLGVGVLAAGAAAGVVVERLTAGRSVRRRLRAAMDASAPFGTLRGTPRTVTADDGTELYVEVDEPAGPARLTVLFAHGYTLNQDAWHFQRDALRGRGLRLAFYDHRGHGRSSRGAPSTATVDQLGRDLGAVLDAVAPSGPVVLVGHSMGGMTVLGLADSRPELFGTRVVGVALLSTTAGRWASVSLGLPAYGAKVVHLLAPRVLRALGNQRDLVERGRQAGSEIAAVFVRRYSFGAETEPEIARFAQRMIESTPIDVVAEFFPTFDAHDKREAARVLRRVPTLILVGERDLLTPPEHSVALAAELPKADLVLVPDAGHLVPLERPVEVTRALGDLIERADAARVADEEEG